MSGMPRTWQNTRTRQLAMQAVMWLALGCAVAIASLTDRVVSTSRSIALGPAISDGSVVYRLPGNWPTTFDEDFGATIRKAIDPLDDAGRRIIIVRQRVDRLMPPLLYLQLTGQLPQSSGNVLVTPYVLKGLPAQTARWVAAGPDGQSKAIVACCAMLPSGEALTVMMERGQLFDDSDQQLFNQVLSAVEFSGPAPLGGGTLQLINGIQITMPGDFAIYPQTDPLRSDRTLVWQTPAGGWISAQCVPMTMGNLPAGSMRGAILALDPLDVRDLTPTANWINAHVTQLDDAHWRIDPRDAPEALVHRRAYVISAKSGLAMLLLLTAQNPAGESDLDQAYSKLRIAIPAQGGINADSLLAAGAALIPSAAQHLTGGEQWWLWQRQEIAEGSTRSYLDPTGQLAVRETLRRNWLGDVWRVTQRWGLGQTPAGLWAQTARYDVPDEATFGSELRDSDQIVTTVHLDGQDLQTKLPDSPAMISGARLPDLMAGLGNSPVAIWTDHFPGYEDQPYPTPQLVILRPLSLGGHGRGVEAEIDGTGQLSHWYFAPDGTFQHADYPGGVSLQPASLADVNSATLNDPRLTPQRQQPSMDSGPQQ
jgi:hypothetical protein